nr:hypothetical protein DLTAUQXX_DLTAUQXX_CDS_0033 [uncultured phage]CAI9750111.1 hypothetical protein LUIDIZRK_LUIDIZRK_CDS_0033 [uncultured phage]
MKIGNIDVSKLFIGGTAVSKAYLGATEVYTASKPMANNEIWYTTTDGNPIADTVLQYNHTFDASGTALTLQSNTYKDGKGVLSYSGDIARIEGQDDEDDYFGAYNNSNTLTSIEFPKTVSKLEFGTLVDCPYVETVVFNSLVLDMGRNPLWVFNNGGTSAHLHSIVIQATTAPTLTTTTLKDVADQGTLYYPTGSDYSAWMTALESAQWKGKAVDDFSDMGRNPLWVFNNGGTSAHLHSIVIQATTAPTLTTTTLKDVADQGTLYYPTGSDYSAWMTALESAQWKGKAVDDFSELFYGMRLSPSSLTLDPSQIDTKLYVRCSESYSLSVEGDIKDQILLPVGGGVADLTGAKTAFTVALKDINLSETKTGTITVKSATYSKTVPVVYYPTLYKEELEWIGNGEDNNIDYNGKVMIDSGYVPNINTNVKLKFSTSRQNSGTLIFGYYTGVFSYTNQYWRFFNNGQSYYFDCPNDGNQRLTIDDRRTSYGSPLEYKVGNMYLNNLTTGVSKSGTPLTANTWKHSLCFFGCDTGNKKWYGDKGIKFYNTQIYEGETLVKDFIPVLDFNNKPCMYEKIGKTFHYNTGEEELTYGRKTTA